MHPFRCAPHHWSTALNRRPFSIITQAVCISICLLPLLSDAHGREPSQTIGDCLVLGQAVPGLETFDQAMAVYMTERSVSAGTLAVSQDGRLVYARGFNCAQKAAPGPVDPATRFRIASITKPITSMAILRLAQLGVLDLDDKVVRYVNLNPQGSTAFDPRINDVTIANLLGHTGGWDITALNFDPMFHDRTIAREDGKALPISQEDIISYMARTPLSHDPGTAKHYSNYGFMLLGRIIEAVTGEEYETHIKTHILEPVGVTVMRLGRSLEEERAAGEAHYRSLYRGTSVFTQTPVTVESPYGGFNLENMDSHGGWIATAPELCRVAASYEVIRAADPTDVTAASGEKQASEWSYYGSLPGTTSVAFHGESGLSFVALINQRDDGSGLEYNDSLFNTLTEAAHSVGSWPTHDLFPAYLGKLPHERHPAEPSLFLLLNDNGL